MTDRCKLDVRKIFFNERLAKSWINLSREVVDSASLELFKRHTDLALRNLV